MQTPAAGVMLILGPCRKVTMVRSLHCARPAAARGAPFLRSRQMPMRLQKTFNNSNHC